MTPSVGGRVEADHDPAGGARLEAVVGLAADVVGVDAVERRCDEGAPHAPVEVGRGGVRDDERSERTLVGTAAVRLLDQQKLVIGRLLNLDEVRHLRNFLNFPEKFSYALATGKRLRHSFSLVVGPSGTGTTLLKAAIHRDHREKRRDTTASR